MISLFTKKNIVSYGISVPPTWDRVRTDVKTDLNVVIEYYKYLNKRSSSNNILSRMIKHIDISIDKDIFDYVGILEDTYMYTSKNQHITSTLNFGKVIEDEMFSSGEILLINDDFGEDLFDLDKTWETVKSIRPIKYDGLNLGMNHPMDIDEDLILTILHIDIKLVMVQYKYWAMGRKRIGFDIDPSIFVYTFLLPSMIGDLYDMALLNRLFIIDSEEDLPKRTTTNKFTLRNMYSVIDRELVKIKKGLVNKNITYDEFLLSIPGIDNDTMYDLMFTGPMLYNKYNLWAEVTGRLDILLNVIRTLDKRGLSKNHKYLNEIFITMRRVQLDHSMSTATLSDLYEIVDFDFNTLLSIAKDRRIL